MATIYDTIIQRIPTINIDNINQNHEILEDLLQEFSNDSIVVEGISFDGQVTIVKITGGIQVEIDIEGNTRLL